MALCVAAIQTGMLSGRRTASFNTQMSVRYTATEMLKVTLDDSGVTPGVHTKSSMRKVVDGSVEKECLGPWLSG